MKPEEMKKAKGIYKCRVCGTIFVKNLLLPEPEEYITKNILINEDDNNYMEMKYRTQILHKCNTNTDKSGIVGIADIIGLTSEDEDNTNINCYTCTHYYRMTCNNIYENTENELFGFDEHDRIPCSQWTTC